MHMPLLLLYNMYVHGAPKSPCHGTATMYLTFLAPTGALELTMLSVRASVRLLLSSKEH